ncbi:MAG: tyrosine-type recombinase/integrase [Sandaracinus sp.]
MPSKTTGTVRFRDGKWRARITIAGTRPELILTTCKREDDAKALERTQLLAELAGRLTHAGRGDLARPLLERAATRDGKALADVVEAVRRLCSGDAAPVSAVVTFGEFAARWTSGALHRRYPDHVKDIDQDNNRERLAKYVLPLVGSVPLPEFGINHADAVMHALPNTLSRATRRHVAQVMSRVLTLAAFPGQIIPRNPLPKGFVPQIGPRKALTFLYPDEDARLLETTTIDLPFRLLYGFLDREGMRRSEAGRLTWSDLDLARGAVKLDTNKTDDPRAWALDPGVARALGAYKRLRKPGSDDLVFVDAAGDSLVDEDDSKIVVRFRRDLKAAGIDRAELFDRSTARLPVRLQDLRATFITVSLANGKSETWVADRTGHKSSVMINRYRRAARQVAELDLGTLLPLDQAIPELRPAGTASDRSGGPQRVRTRDDQGLMRDDAPRSVASESQFSGGSDGTRPFATEGRDSKSAVRKGLRVRVPPRLSHPQRAFVRSRSGARPRAA